MTNPFSTGPSRGSASPPGAAGGAPVPLEASRLQTILQQLAVDGAWRMAGDSRLVQVPSTLAGGLSRSPLPQPITAAALEAALADPDAPVLLLRAGNPLPLPLIESLASRSPLPKTLLIEESAP